MRLEITYLVLWDMMPSDPRGNGNNALTSHDYWYVRKM